MTALPPLTRKRLEVLHKFEKLWIIDTSGDMEGERQDREDILAQSE